MNLREAATSDRPTETVPAVVEAAVVGRDDPERTQVVVAFCVLAEGQEPSTETVSGKIRRTELRGWLKAGAVPAESGAMSLPGQEG